MQPQFSAAVMRGYHAEHSQARSPPLCNDNGSGPRGDPSNGNSLAHPFRESTYFRVLSGRLRTHLSCTTRSAANATKTLGIISRRVLREGHSRACFDTVAGRPQVPRNRYACATFS
jgi:hypothetical protein